MTCLHQPVIIIACAAVAPLHTNGSHASYCLRDCYPFPTAPRLTIIGRNPVKINALTYLTFLTTGMTMPDTRPISTPVITPAIKSTGR